LSDYRDEAIAVLTPLGVEIDDAWLFYQTRSPTDFGLPLPTRSETGPFWKWDGVHFDESYRQFEGERVADLVRGILV
jgi:hypothetical protein